MKYVGLVIIGFLLIGCAEPTQESDPHEQAIEFFNALYNEDDLERAANFASEDYRRVLLHYGAPSSVGRYLFSMNFDEVEITADRRGVSLYQNRADTARLNVSLSGRHNGRLRESLREVVMVREDGAWKLDRVLDGPMN